MNYPLSNTDLHQLVAALGIKNFRGVFCRDALPSRSHKVECSIVKLDDLQGPGTQWSAYRITKEGNEYFDSFGLSMPEEVAVYLGQKVKYSPDELQDRDTVFCGWWCLYFLFERQKVHHYSKSCIQKRMAASSSLITSVFKKKKTFFFAYV